MTAGLVAGVTPSASADAYNPPPGVKLAAPIKSPYGNYTIFNHVIRAINSVPRHQKIRIASWNMRSPRIFHALVRAARRGVSVQVVVDRENANHHMEYPNPGFFWMKQELRKTNKGRPPGHRSYAKACVRSCRGKYGISHTKMYLFSQSYHSHYVVMYGSFNATDLAAQIQWNDMYTTVARSNLYHWAIQRFNEYVKDRPLANPWSQAAFGPILMGMFPYEGKGAVGDPILRVLNQVKCRGATGGTGNHGRTVIRIAQTSEAYARGERIARKLKSLWDAGCDIRMLSAIYGDRDRAIYRSRGPRGPMPFRQIAQDFDGDGLYDRYMHTKVMTVSGVVGSKTNAQYSYNGSANWEAYVLHSDDIFTRIDNPYALRHYNRYINYWWNHVPPKPHVSVYQQLRILNGQLDPYAKIQVN